MNTSIEVYNTLNAFIEKMKTLNKNDCSNLASRIFADVPTISSSNEERIIGFLKISVANTIIQIGGNNDHSIPSKRVGRQNPCIITR